MNAYFISGLGADERAFSKISLPSRYTSQFINWIPPQKNESLPAYAARLSAAVDPSSPFILIGLSLGGMVAAEIARIHAPQKLILISSVSNRNELPWYFRTAGKLNMQKLIPVTLLKKGTVLNSIMAGRNEATRKMIGDFSKNTDPQFIRWALDAILNWQQTERLPGTLHIHGGADKLLPAKYVRADHVIPKGKHLVILDNAVAVNEILAKELLSIA